LGIRWEGADVGRKVKTLFKLYILSQPHEKKKKKERKKKKKTDPPCW
jgi:hypothetical protein